MHISLGFMVYSIPTLVLRLHPRSWIDRKSQVTCHVNINRVSGILLSEGMLYAWFWTLTIPHCSLRHNGLTATGAIVLAGALQHNKSLKELKWVGNWQMLWLDCQCCRVRLLRAKYAGMWELDAGCFYRSTGIILICVYSLFSLDWDDYQWTAIGDEGASALAHLRVMKNFKTLK